MADGSAGADGPRLDDHWVLKAPDRMSLWADGPWSDGPGLDGPVG